MVDNNGLANSRVGGFSAPLGGSEARRQLHLSLGLVTMLAIGIVSAGIAVGGHPIAIKQDALASRAPVTAMHAQAGSKVPGVNPI